MRRGCCAATEPTSPRPNRIDSWLPPSVRERRPDDRRVPAVSSLSRAEPRLADSVSRVRAGAVSATNIRTMPVVLAHWNGKAYRLDLPDGTHYAETKGGVIRIVAKHAPGSPIRFTPTSRSADEREPSRAVREDPRRLSEGPVSGTGYQVRRRVSLSTPAPHSHDRRSSGSTRRTVSSDAGSVPVTSQPFRPSEGASLKRGPSLAPTHPLSAATRSTPPGRS